MQLSSPFIPILLFIVGSLLFYKFLFIPLKAMRFYKAQGLDIKFFPVVGSLVVDMLSGYSKKGDVLANFKHLLKKENDIKGTVRNFGNTPFVLLVEPNLKKEIAFNHHLYEMPNLFGEFGWVFTQGLLGVRNEQWKKQRKIISQSFHFEFLKDNIPIIVETTQQFLNEIAQGELKKVPVLLEMEKITGEIIGRVFFSQNLKKYNIKGVTVANHLMNIVARLGKLFLSPGFLVFGPKYVELGIFKSHRDLQDDIQQLQNTLRQVLADKKSSTEIQKDFSWSLLESQKNFQEEDRLTDEEIIANYVTFIIAGTNTTSHLVSMIIYLLATDPAVLDKLQEEIKSIYNTELIISYDSLNQMNWLSAIVKEALRMYNPTGVGAGFRNAIADHKIGDINIKKGTMAGAFLLYSSYNEKYFENPFEFNPQRWIEKPNITEPFVYTPFWAGPRNGIGQHLAQIEAKIIVCEFVKMFKFSLEDGYKLKLHSKKAYGPADDLPMNLILS